MTIALAKSDIGRRVIYRPEHDAPAEEGVIVGFNKRFVFVRYGPEAATPKATHRKHLTWPVTTAPVSVS